MLVASPSVYGQKLAAPPITPSLDPSQYNLTVILTGLSFPVYVTNADDGTNRLFVVERLGQVRVIKNGVLLPTPFLDLTDWVSTDTPERGFLSMAFHPDYAHNGWFFVDYTDLWGNIVVARYTVSADDANVADPGSAELIISVFPSDQAYHYGGQIEFGPDGYLYIGVGDSGSLDRDFNSAQDPRSYLGKLLRLDVNGDLPYAIPPDNPFVQNTSFSPEVWALGLRNPWRFSFDRATGDLYLPDVGEREWEEINFQSSHSRGGENYGWNIYEGRHQFADQMPSSTIVLPAVEYAHDEGCAVIGGYVYRGTVMPGLQGAYLYADFCSGKVWAMYRDELEAWHSQQLFEIGDLITSFGQDEEGELYITNYRGVILKLIPT
jgi:glucose/arabinose dehydrogenase